MAILAQAADSVFWLLAGTDETNERLRQPASQTGVSSERLIFAEKKANPEHLALGACGRISKRVAFRYRICEISISTMRVAPDLDFESTELLAEDAYRSLYARKLANRHDTYPIMPDARLWRGPS